MGVPNAGWRLPGLMYADDLVLLADTKEKLKEMLRTASQVVPHMAHAGQRSQMRSDALSKAIPRAPPLRPQISGCLFGTEQGLPRESSSPR